MSKTIEELVELYRCAYSELDYVAPFQDCEVYERAGVIAVVRALRDEIAFTNDNCGVCVSIRRIFNEILGDAGNEKAAGLVPVVAMPAEQNREVQSPAAPTTAPETCDWTPDGRNLWFAWCPKQMGHRSYSKAPTHCHTCGKPIKFKEEMT